MAALNRLSEKRSRGAATPPAPQTLALSWQLLVEVMVCWTELYY